MANDRKPTKAQMAEAEAYKAKQYRQSRMDQSESVKVNPVRFKSNIEFEMMDAEPSDARITHQLKYMAENLAELSAVLFELEERIMPILLPPTNVPSDPEVAAQATSELSRVIDDHNGSISELQRRVRALNRRVQL